MSVLKKFIVFCLIAFLVLFLFTKNSPGGFRGGDVFQNNSIDAMNIHFGSVVNMETLSELHDCDGEISIQVFWDNESKSIHCATFEKKKDKVAYLYGYDFIPERINDKSGLSVYEVKNNCDVVYGIMPGNKSGVIINQSIMSDSFSFEVNGIQYKCWYALVEGGYSAVENASYQ